MHRLISALVIRYLDSFIYLESSAKIARLHLAFEFVSDCVENPIDRFSSDATQIGTYVCRYDSDLYEHPNEDLTQL